LSKNYYKPTEKEVLDDYLRTVDVLTFSVNSETLNKKIKDLEEQNKNTDYIIKGNLQEKDEKVQSLTNEFLSVKDMLNRLIKILFETKDQKHVNSVTRSLFSTGIIKQIES
jgi:Ni,Fe-hydrogenase III component G